MLDETVAAVWKGAYGAEAVQISDDNAAKLTKKQVVDIIVQNNAEFGVFIAQQIMHGCLDETQFVGTGKMTAQTQIGDNELRSTSLCI